MTDKILEQIKQLITEYNAIQNLKYDAYHESNKFQKITFDTRHDIFNCENKLKQHAIKNPLDCEEYKLIAATLKKITTDQEELAKQYKKAREYYSELKTNADNLGVKINELRDQYWSKKGLVIVEKWHS